MATNFLRAGIIKEQLDEIYDAAQYLWKLLQSTPQEQDSASLGPRDTSRAQGLLANPEISKALETILRTSESTKNFIDSLPCEPLIYTGEGDTESVILMLENLVNQQQYQLDRHRPVPVRGEERISK